MYSIKSNYIKVYAQGLKGLRTIQGLSQTTNNIFVIVGYDGNVKNDYSKDIEFYCSSQNIRFFKVDNDSEKEEFGLAIAAGWTRMVLGIPEEKLIIFHDSLLPKYRGFNPLVTALLNKDSEIGVTALFAADKYDRGAIVAQERLEINYPILISEAIEKISELYYILANLIYKKFQTDTLYGVIQNEELATYSLWRDEDDYWINWSLSSAEIVTHVNSVGFPYLGAMTSFDNKKYRIHSVTEIQDLIIENRTPGKIIFYEGNRPIVVCGFGLIRIDEVTDNDGNIVVFNKIRIRFN